MEPWLDPQHQIKRAVMVHVCNPCICVEAGGTDVQGHVWLHETLFLGTKTYPYQFKVRVVNSSLSPVATYLYNSLYVSKDPTGGSSLWRNVGKQACAARVWGWVLLKV